MTQVVKAVPTPSTVTVAGGRLAAGSRNVASVDRASPIDEISETAGASFNGGGFRTHEYAGDLLDRQSQHRHRTGGDASRFSTSTQSFAAMIESQDFVTAATAGGGGGVKPRRIAGLLARAIKVYETNAKVISGTLESPGARVSVNF